MQGLSPRCMEADRPTWHDPQTNKVSVNDPKEPKYERVWTVHWHHTYMSSASCVRRLSMVTIFLLVIWCSVFCFVFPRFGVVWWCIAGMVFTIGGFRVFIFNWMPVSCSVFEGITCMLCIVLLYFSGWIQVWVYGHTIRKYSLVTPDSKFISKK